MTSIWNTDDTQRLACTPISTPEGSLHSRAPLQSFAWDEWENHLAKNLRKVKSVFNQFLFRSFVTLIRIQVVQLSQENSKKSCSRKISVLLSPYLPPPVPSLAKHHKSVLSGVLDQHLNLQILRLSKFFEVVQQNPSSQNLFSFEDCFGSETCFLFKQSEILSMFLCTIYSEFMLQCSSMFMLHQCEILLIIVATSSLYHLPHHYRVLYAYFYRTLAFYFIGPGSMLGALYGLLDPHGKLWRQILVVSQWKQRLRDSVTCPRSQPLNGIFHSKAQALGLLGRLWSPTFCINSVLIFTWSTCIYLSYCKCFQSLINVLLFKKMEYVLTGPFPKF